MANSQQPERIIHAWDKVDDDGDDQATASSRKKFPAGGSQSIRRPQSANHSTTQRPGSGGGGTYHRQQYHQHRDSDHAYSGPHQNYKQNNSRYEDRSGYPSKSPSSSHYGGYDGRTYQTPKHERPMAWGTAGREDRTKRNLSPNIATTFESTNQYPKDEWGDLTPTQDEWGESATTTTTPHKQIGTLSSTPTSQGGRSIFDKIGPMSVDIRARPTHHHEQQLASSPSSRVSSTVGEKPVNQRQQPQQQHDLLTAEMANMNIASKHSSINNSKRNHSPSPNSPQQSDLQHWHNPSSLETQKPFKSPPPPTTTTTSIHSRLGPKQAAEQPSNPPSSNRLSPTPQSHHHNSPQHSPGHSPARTTTASPSGRTFQDSFEGRHLTAAMAAAPLSTSPSGSFSIVGMSKRSTPSPDLRGAGTGAVSPTPPLVEESSSTVASSVPSNQSRESTSSPEPPSQAAQQEQKPQQTARVFLPLPEFKIPASWADDVDDDDMWSQS